MGARVGNGVQLFFNCCCSRFSLILFPYSAKTLSFFFFPPLCFKTLSPYQRHHIYLCQTCHTLSLFIQGCWLTVSPFWPWLAGQCSCFSLVVYCSVEPHMSGRRWILLKYALLPGYCARWGPWLILAAGWICGPGWGLTPGTDDYLMCRVPRVCPDLSRKINSSTMSCKWRTLGLRDGDCPFEPRQVWEWDTPHQCVQ